MRRVFLLLLSLLALLYPIEAGSVEPSVDTPSDLHQCHAWLDSHLKKEDREKIRKGGDMSFLKPLGMLLRNTWGLWHGSRLRDFFIERGITHPDRMSAIVLESYTDNLRGTPSRVDELFRWYNEAERVALPASTMNCPSCKTQLQYKGLMGDTSPEGRPRCIRLGFCSLERELWFFEHGRRWYLPPKEEAESLIRELKELEAWEP